MKKLAILLLLAIPLSSCAWSNPHYVFLLPDGYAGWVQIIFTDAGKSPKPIVENGNLILDLDEDGIFRTPTFQITHVDAHDEFFYKRPDSKGRVTRVPVASDFVCPEVSGLDTCYGLPEDQRADAFTVGRVTAGKPGPSSDGSSWFLFIGPPALRSKHAVRVTLQPQTGIRMDVPENDPTPGRIKDEH